MNEEDIDRIVATLVPKLLQHIAELASPRAVLPVADEPVAPYMSVFEFAQRWRVTPETVRRWVRSGMPCRRPRPRLIRIPVAEAEGWLEERPRQPSASGKIAARKGAA